MKSHHFILQLIACFMAQPTLADEPLPLSKSYWKDTSFLKAFNGSYRINARVEPAVTTAERGLLVSIQPLMAAGKREQALAKLTSSPLAKTSAAVQFNIGNIQFELGEMKKATTAYQSALKTFPSFLRAHRNLGFVFARENDWKQAVPQLEEAIRLGDQNAATYGQLGYGRLNAEQYATALQTYRLAQVTDSNNIDWKAGIAQCLQHLSRNEEALTLMEEVIRARPTEVSYYLLQSSIQISMDQHDAAMANLEMVRRLGKLDAENHLLLATLHLRAGSDTLARPLLMAALKDEKKPPMQSALNALDFVTKTQQWKLAQDFATTITTTWPEVKDEKLAQQQMRLSAVIDIQSESNPKRGAKTLESLVKKNPLDAEALILLGKHRAATKRTQEAIMLFEQAARIEGHEYTALVELAKTQVATGDYKKALTHLDAALKISQTDNMQEYRNAVAKLATAAE